MKTENPNSKSDTLLSLPKLAEILFVTSYPPRECGIATYSQDLIKSLNNKFSNSLSIHVCALENNESHYEYPSEVTETLNTSNALAFDTMAEKINQNGDIKIVLIQHEFGFFAEQELAFLRFIHSITKPIVMVFHTVLPKPIEFQKSKIQYIATECKSIIVMTNRSAEILIEEYNIPKEKISVIAHGTHLVPHLSKNVLKEKYDLTDRKVLSTFGLLSSGKSIETTIDALPTIVAKNPNVMFLIIGKTHPEVKKHDGEQYREMLEQKVRQLKLTDNVRFINNYLALPELLEYLQLTDIYLFTTNDPNQAVSGTFAYAMSCACPIISTPIPHAQEVLTNDTGIIFDFRNSDQLANAVLKLLNDEDLRKNISSNTLQKIVSTAWENSAVEHAMLFESIASQSISLQYNVPEISLTHIQKMTTDVGFIQFSKINQPDIESGYTLDDNARALIAMCMYYKSTKDNSCINDINIYLSFLKFCLQPSGTFMNYVDKNNRFTVQNFEVNLDDSNGRTIWALGYLLSLKDILPAETITTAEFIITKALPHIVKIHSTRAMAFAIKGLYYYSSINKSPANMELAEKLSNRLVQMYQHESTKSWEWFEDYLTYANSILPEAMVYAWLLTKEKKYEDIAKMSMNFLLSQIFNENGIEVISNRSWLQKGQELGQFGEQPIDVAYTIMSLSTFYDVFESEEYRKKMEIAFNWFLGKNRLHQIVYNPCTGGCYDGLEDSNVNLNQGAESTISYLMARLTIEKYQKPTKKIQNQLVLKIRKSSKKEEIMIQMAFRNLTVLSSHHFITNATGVTSIEEKCIA